MYAFVIKKIMSISDFIRLFHSSFRFLVPYFTLYSYGFGKICPEFWEISVSYM